MADVLHMSGWMDRSGHQIGANVNPLILYVQEETCYTSENEHGLVIEIFGD